MIDFSQAPMKHGTDEQVKALAGSALPDWMIRAAGVFDPFVDYGECPEGKISYGVTSAGYDIRLKQGVKLFVDNRTCVIDPKAPVDDKELAFVPIDTPEVIIPPNSYILGVSVERFKVPRNWIGVCWGKSTYARSGIIVNITPQEPGWEGHLVVEVANGTRLPAKVYTGEGIAQVMFLELRAECQRSYPEKPNAKYQGQPGDRVTLAKV